MGRTSGQQTQCKISGGIQWWPRKQRPSVQNNVRYESNTVAVYRYKGNAVWNTDWHRYKGDIRSQHRNGSPSERDNHPSFSKPWNCFFSEKQYAGAYDNNEYTDYEIHSVPSVYAIHSQEYPILHAFAFKHRWRRQSQFTGQKYFGQKRT